MLSSGNSKNMFAVFREEDSADEVEHKKEKKPKKIKVKKEIPEPTNSGSIYSKINNPKKNKKNLPAQAEIVQPQEKTSTQTKDENRAMKKKKQKTKSTKMSILTRACLLVAHVVLITVTRNIINEHFAKYDMLHKVVWQTQVLYFTLWNLHLISQYFFLRVVIEVAELVFGSKYQLNQENRTMILSKLHYILLTCQIAVMFGYWGIARSDFLKGDFKNADTTTVLCLDLRHLPQIFFLLIDCFQIREKLVNSKQVKMLPVYFSLLYLVWHCFVTVFQGIDIYKKNAWKSLGSYIEIITMLLVTLVSAFVSMFIKNCFNYANKIGKNLK